MRVDRLARITAIKSANFNMFELLEMVRGRAKRHYEDSTIREIESWAGAITVDSPDTEPGKFLPKYSSTKIAKIDIHKYTILGSGMVPSLDFNTSTTAPLVIPVISRPA